MERIKEVLLGIIIAVVLLMFLVFGAKLIYEKPDYQDYCDYNKINFSNNSENQKCFENYENAQEKFSKKMFILSLIVSVVLIVGSTIFININSISGGLMFGSLMFVIYGTSSYWKHMNDWIRFIILGIVLGILIYVGYWLSSRGEKKKKKRRK